MINHPVDIDRLVTIAIGAGDILCNEWGTSQAVTIKQDGSPVTKADQAANAYITHRLNQYFPSIPIVSEEQSDAVNQHACQSSAYFMVDPLDGTKAFIQQSKNFTVNIGYIDRGLPRFGVIHHPMSQSVYYTSASGKAMKKTPSNHAQITASQHHRSLRVVMTSQKSEATTILDELSNQAIPIEWVQHVSSAYKFCLLAEGMANIYPRRQHIRAWDMAAGHAILNGALGHIVSCHGAPITYHSLIMPPFNAYGQHTR